MLLLVALTSILSIVMVITNHLHLITILFDRYLSAEGKVEIMSAHLPHWTYYLLMTQMNQYYHVLAFQRLGRFALPLVSWQPLATCQLKESGNFP